MRWGIRPQSGFSNRSGPLRVLVVGGSLGAKALNETVPQALALLAQPKQRGRAAAVAKPPLKELGTGPASGSPMVVKEGRFGPYVTDGETNASLRKGDDVASLTDERASELLADRRARGPVKRTATKTIRKKAPTKKASAKKAAAKKA